ncbi:MAG: hypothetical protein IJ366_10385 [Clostridia bacterium]|nr:hypothetical protein [Clostridia bacterium]
MDIFSEYIVSKRKTGTDYAIIFGIIVAASLLTVILMLLTTAFIQYAGGIGLLLIVGCWWGALKLIKARNIEYEYILTNHELDIDKIIARNGRKRLCTINFRQIEQCASVTDPNFAHIFNNTEGKTVKNYAGDMESGLVYFVDYSKESERIRVIFQPNEKILDGIKKANPRLVAVKDGDI